MTNFENAKELCLLEASDDCEASLLSVSSTEAVINEFVVKPDELFFIDGRSAAVT